METSTSGIPQRIQQMATDYNLGAFVAEYPSRIAWLVTRAILVTIILLPLVALIGFMLLSEITMSMRYDGYRDPFSLFMFILIFGIFALFFMFLLFLVWKDMLIGVGRRIYLHKGGFVLSHYGQFRCYPWEEVQELREYRLPANFYRYYGLLGRLLGGILTRPDYRCLLDCTDGTAIRLSSRITENVDEFGAFCSEGITNTQLPRILHGFGAGKELFLTDSTRIDKRGITGSAAEGKRFLSWQEIDHAEETERFIRIYTREEVSFPTLSISTKDQPNIELILAVIDQMCEVS
ncbi:DUF6585 family protein [Ktedonobacter sp. SOSP1-52]|uniref:DUF6585 family protein n=1 Tax=Ktedonobacter sp. SOSP1-52 TaxID=2778366 RepID=UPI001916826C|nr:DUF6585 family protein [Ktedonobacter sp. SOSP1-52]